MNKPNISDIHNCYGCGVCTKACPVHIIDLHLNKEGFYEPFIAEEDKCIHCGLCRDVCAYIKDEPAQNNAPVVSRRSAVQVALALKSANTCWAKDIR